MKYRRGRLDASDEIMRYLLHLPGCDRDAVEERLFQEDGFAEVLETAERDLIDAYVRGTLPDDLRSRVETELLFDERQRDKLLVARALLGDKPRARFRWAIPAIAATLLVVGSLAFYLYFTPAHKTAVQSATAARRASTATAPLQPFIQTFLLTPGVLRGSGLQSITVAANASSVRLELADVEGSGTFSGSLLDESGTTVWSGDDLPAKDGGIEITIPATLLRPGQYRVALAGNPPLTYYFRVESRPLDIQREGAPVKRIGPAAH